MKKRGGVVVKVGGVVSKRAEAGRGGEGVSDRQTDSWWEGELNKHSTVIYSCMRGSSD